jgi:hypothetical protein
MTNYTQVQRIAVDLEWEPPRPWRVERITETTFITGTVFWAYVESINLPQIIAVVGSDDSSQKIGRMIWWFARRCYGWDLFRMAHGEP